MADSTLSIGYEDLVKAVAFFLGFGRKESTELAADELALVDGIVQGGYREFLFPPVLPRETVAHVWSFLRPAATLSLVATVADYDLPDDFGGMVGSFHYAPGSVRPSVPIMGEGQILAARAGSNLTGYPRIAAIRPKAPTGTADQKFEVLVYPTPAGSYTWHYQYNVLVNKLTPSSPKPLGAMNHGQTILESCLAVAERGNDELGVHHEAFLRRLEASVAYDRQVMSPKTLGYNGDPSVRAAAPDWAGYVTYNGTLYGAG